ncbi:MAG: hypothetical protein ACN0LA_08725 [Candidatus Longimicrobiales bacterium M2_2A_002]
MIEIGRLREQPANPDQVAAIWKEAVESARDAEIEELSIDGALRSAYDAGHLAALAVLAAHGLRPGSGQGHHEMAFAGAAAFGYEGLEDLVADSMEVRALRKGSMYDPVIAGPEDRDLALEWVRRALPAIRDALAAADPDLRPVLEAYP